MTEQAQPRTGDDPRAHRLAELLARKEQADAALAAELEAEMRALKSQLAQVRARYKALLRPMKRAVTVEVIVDKLNLALETHENGTPEALKAAVLERLRSAGYGPLTGIAKTYRKALDELGLS